jgi:LEA14-like dessication related protein
MASGNKSLLYIAGAVAAIYFGVQALRYRQVANKLLYTLGDVSIDGTKIRVTINILNPTGVSATIKSIAGDMLTNGNKIATVQYFGKTIVSANASTAITIELVPSVLGIVSTISNALYGGYKPNFKLIGTANVNNISIPLNITN